MAIVLLILIGMGCEKTIEPRYKMSVQKDFVLPAGLNTIETHVVVLEDVDTQYLSSLAVNNIGVDQVKSVSGGAGRLALVTGAENLVFVREVKVRARSKKNASNTANMYYQDQINYNQGQEIVLFNTLANLKDHFQENTIDIEVRFKLRGTSPNEILMRLFFEYGVYTDE